MHYCCLSLGNWLGNNLRNILVINILLIVLVSDCVQCLDSEKDNSTSVSADSRQQIQLDEHNGDFGSEEEEFTLDSAEQL
jgi:predicted RND superfamily exporter protein